MSNITKNNLDKLKAQRAKIDARIHAAEARNKVTERKRDTRRKILVGSYYLDQAKENNHMDEIVKIMHSFLIRNSDRELFGLDPLDEKEETKSKMAIAKN